MIIKFLTSMFKAILFVIFLISLTGCGFHLRGKFPIPDEYKIITLYPEQNLDPFTRALKITLMSNGIRVKRPGCEEENCIPKLSIISQNYTERNVAYGSDVQASRALMQLILVYQMQNSCGKIIIPTSIVKIEREFQVNPNAVLGTENERNQTLNELYLDASSQLLRQLSIALSKLCY